MKQGDVVVVKHSGKEYIATVLSVQDMCVFVTINGMNPLRVELYNVVYEGNLLAPFTKFINEELF